ncbi:amino acid/amide ABC transporter membrane protein 2, HAAT family [Micromonospora pallida]|uniref:Amino acid/amide ABC transporter membrane protein 2, HAAT family n=1 Tax=Micromonospora pallida TaxID=145854 RepID=A0A1C6RSX9_9ACTN|nr:branched-chain amino acid ABC transporter permease [Micromonospora pallida]SCL20162.1 amino acid/amide ABC transporter membrane protein 2, HAAT family [Micromonospora pallida]
MRTLKSPAVLLAAKWRTAARPPAAKTPGRAWSSLRPVAEPIIFAAVTSILYFSFDQSLQFVLMTGVVYALLTASLGVLLGWSGIYTFGHAAFFGIGAYTAGLLKDRDMSPLLFLLAGAAVAAVIALVVGLLGARIVAVEFAMMTLIIGQVVYLLTFKIEGLQGDNGIFGIPSGTIGGWDIATEDNLWWYIVAVVAVLLGLLRRIQLSPYGVSLNAVRDDPVKAAAVGLPVRALRLSAFVLSGAVAGVAGVLYAQQQGIVTPSTLSFTFSGQIIIMALFGGLYRFWGAPIGAIVFLLLNNQIFGETSHGTLILGVILLFIVVLMPGGILGVADWIRDRVKVVR